MRFWFFLLIAFSLNCSAEVLFDDDFYASNQRFTPPYWYGSGTVTFGNGFLTIPGPDSSGFVNPEYSLFSAQSGTTVYAGFTFAILYPPTASVGPLFAFQGSGTSVGRMVIASGSDSTTFQVGIENAQGTPVYWPAALKVGQRYRAVVAVTDNGALDFSKLWIDPLEETSPSVADSPEAFFSSQAPIDRLSFHTVANNVLAKIWHVTVATTFPEVTDFSEDFGIFTGKFKGWTKSWVNGTFQGQSRDTLESEGGFEFAQFDARETDHYAFNPTDGTWSCDFPGGNAGGTYLLEGSVLRMKGHFRKGNLSVPVRMKFRLRPDGKLKMILTGSVNGVIITETWVGKKN